MPTGVSGLHFFEEQIYGGFYQGITANLDVFAERSAGALNVSDGGRPGRAPEETYFGNIPGLVQRRNASGGGSLVPSVFADGTWKRINVHWTAPLTFAAQDFKDRGQMASETAQFQYGLQMAEHVRDNMVTAALSAAVGALVNLGSAAMHDLTGQSGDARRASASALNVALGKLGDQRGRAAILACRSEPLTDLYGEGITSQAIAYKLQQQPIYNATLVTANLPVLNTDSSPLLITNTGSTPNHYQNLVLMPGAIQIETGGINSELVFFPGAANGGEVSENHTYLLTSEGHFTLSVRGMSFSGNAEQKITDAILATNSNWTDKTGGSVKNGPGIILKTVGNEAT